MTNTLVTATHAPLTFQPTPPEVPTPASQPATCTFEAIFLLAGGVTPSPLVRATGRSALDLPISRDATVLSQWCAQTADPFFGQPLPVRLLIESHRASPRYDALPGLSVCHDRSEYRGAGGALADAAHDLPDDAWILAAPAAQILLQPLSQLVSMLSRDRAAEVILAANRDGTPGTLLLARAAVLRRIPSVGFVDLKEQALPLLARHAVVRVHRFDSPIASSIRTPSEYLRALHLQHSAQLPGTAASHTHSSFSLVEDPASVSPQALLHNSVVLAGAEVPSRTVLVRCLACPGAVLTPGRTYVDQTLTAPSASHRHRNCVPADPSPKTNPNLHAHPLTAHREAHP